VAGFVSSATLAGICIGIAATVGTAAVLVGSRDDHPRRPKAPPPTGAFATGGTPTTDAAVEAAIRRLPAVATVDFADRPRLAAAWSDFAAGADGPDHRVLALAVDDELAAADLGYYIDPAQLRAYRVAHVSVVRAGDDRAHVLELRALTAQALDARLGMTEELGEPAVLLDSIDAKVELAVLPLLAEPAFPFGDDGWTNSYAGRQLAAAAGQGIRAELVTALGSDAADATRARARAIQLVAASVGHHEAQHALDATHDLPYPQPLSQILVEKHGDPFAVRARFELSAYTSQIASDMWLPQLSLWSLARHGFHAPTQRSPEGFVAVVVIEGLARHLGIPSPGPVVHGGQIDRDRLAALGVALSQRSTVELRSAAAALWAELFDAKLPRIVDDTRRTASVF
jgi:hypothetical protein